MQPNIRVAVSENIYWVLVHMLAAGCVSQMAPKYQLDGLLFSDPFTLCSCDKDSTRCWDEALRHMHESIWGIRHQRTETSAVRPRAARAGLQCYTARDLWSLVMSQ